MQKSQWLAGILALIVLVVIGGTQLGMHGGDWLFAVRTGLEIAIKVGWLLAALGAVALALRTHEQAAGFFALALVIGAAGRYAQFLGGARPWQWIGPLNFVLMALALLKWAPGPVPRWVLAVGGFRTALQWLILASAGFVLTPVTGALVNLVLIVYWALFAAAAWRGARTLRPLAWLFWEGIFSVAMLVFSEVQLLFPTTLSGNVAWLYLLLLPLPLVTTLGFVWSAFSGPRIVS